MPTKTNKSKTLEQRIMSPLRLSSGLVWAMPQNFKLLQCVFSFQEDFPSSSQVQRKSQHRLHTNSNKYLADNQKSWIPVLKDANSHTSQLHSFNPQEIAQSPTLQITGMPMMSQGWHRAINQQLDPYPHCWSPLWAGTKQRNPDLRVSGLLIKEPQTKVLSFSSSNICANIKIEKRAWFGKFWSCYKHTLNRR